MKKKNLVILSVLLCSFLIFAFKGFESKNNNQIVPPLVFPYPNNNISDKFLFGMIHDEATDASYNYSHTQQLGLNVAHSYPGSESLFVKVDPITLDSIFRHYPRGRTDSDGVMNGINSYVDGVRNIIDNVYSSSSGTKRMLLHRPKIEWLCYGHSSTYQCEDITAYTTDLWFYSFNDHIGTNYTDRDVQGRYCKYGDQPGYVVSRLKANTEQCNIGHGTDAWRCDSECRWFVKPKIKVPQQYILNSDDEETVCFVNVITHDGSTKTGFPKELKVKNFKDGNGNYNGDYLEEFYFETGVKSAMFFDGDLGNHNPAYLQGKNYVGFAARGTRPNDDGLLNKSDITVEWAGNCDMWIDYVKVESDVADQLLKGVYDDPTHPELQWIKQEVEQIGLYNGGGTEPVAIKFYVELSEFKNLPCIKYVNAKLKEYSSGKVDLMMDYTDWNLGHVTWDERSKISTPEWTYKNYFQYVGFTQFFAESYPMTSEYKDPIDSAISFISFKI